MIVSNQGIAGIPLFAIACPPRSARSFARPADLVYLAARRARRAGR